MGCIGKIIQFVSLILGAAGTAMGIYAVYKIYQDTGITPWCDTCMETAKNSDENCTLVCSKDIESSLENFVDLKLQKMMDDG